MKHSSFHGWLFTEIHRNNKLVKLFIRLKYDCFFVFFLVSNVYTCMYWLHYHKESTSMSVWLTVYRHDPLVFSAFILCISCGIPNFFQYLYILIIALYSILFCTFSFHETVYDDCKNKRHFSVCILKIIDIVFKIMHAFRGTYKHVDECTIIIQNIGKL